MRCNAAWNKPCKIISRPFPARRVAINIRGFTQDTRTASCYTNGMLHSSRVSWYLLTVLILGLSGIANGQNAFTVTGPSFPDALSGGPPPVPFPNASFDVSSSPSGSIFIASTSASGQDAFVTLAASADQCPGSHSVSSSTPVTLFACVDTTNLVRGSYASLITISSFDGSIPTVRVPVQVPVVPIGEIKTTPGSSINLSSTSPHQSVSVQFVANNGASGGASNSACGDASTGNGSGSASACIASIAADPASPPEGSWMTLSNNCSGVALVGNVTCSIQVTADGSKLKNAVIGSTYVSHLIIESTHGDRADLVVSFLYSQSSGPALTITSGTTFTGTGGQAFQATLTATGGTPPYTWSATGLPGTLSLNATTGVISGTPSVGTYPVNITVKDSANVTTGPQQITINIQSKPAVTQLFPHITDGYDGSVWQSDFLLFNTNSTTVTAQLIFHLDNGVQKLSIIGTGAVTGISGITIQPFGSAIYSTSGLVTTTPLVSGWVEVVSSLPVQGQVVFRRNTSPTTSLGNYYEVSVPLVAPASSFTFPFDGTTYTAASARIYTALAIANASNSPAVLNCTAYGTNGALLGPMEQVASLAALAHTEEVLQFSSPIDTLIQQGRGILTCTSTAPIGILGLRAFGDHALSALPIVSGN